MRWATQYFSLKAIVDRLIQRATHGLGTAVQHVRVDLGGSDILVAQQLLDSPDIVAVFQQMRGE